MNIQAINKESKIQRKLQKLQHVLKKECQVNISSTPTKNLSIANSGLINGLTEEILYEYFHKFGNLCDIIMLPGKSCSFVQFDEIEPSKNAYETYNGKLCIAQNEKPIYLFYIEDIPQLNLEITWNEYPEGLKIIKDFISEEEEIKLIDLCKFQEGNSGSMKNRLVKHFGYEFNYETNNIDRNKPLEENLPSETDYLWIKLVENYNFVNFKKPDQLTINHYLPGQGIPHHIDTHSAFEDPIMCLSLSSSIIMEFKNNAQNKHFCVLLPQRSLLIMSGESRYNWTHGIVPRKFDIIKNTNNHYNTFKRTTRISFTFRKILQQGKCECIYTTNCDSAASVNNVDEDLTNFLELEKLHVHRVYETIAEHFSETRHTPWPNVLNFIQNNLNNGDILVDVGCGNGKYLGYNKDNFIYELGCDRSTNLIEICKNRNFEAFIMDCLAIPLKNNCADGVISIAVIHHLTTENRRLKAIEEIVRILKIHGKALIYVWANQQIKNQNRSTYLKQKHHRKKSSTEEANTTYAEVKKFGQITLPVHKNRENFNATDLLVPWKLKDSAKTTFLRYYHVFKENELENLCLKLDNCKILQSYYDEGNWCVCLEKSA